MSTISTAERERIRTSTAPRAWSSFQQLLWVGVKYTALLALALMMLLPLLWMISSSLKTRSEVFSFPPQWIPDPIVWENYVEAWTAYPFDIFTFNSLKIATLTVLGQLLVCSMGGYGFARFNFPLKNAMFTMLLAVMLIPAIVNIVPLFILFKRIGWIDTHWTVIVPPVLANTFGTFLFRQFMLTIPQDLEDAARIDGASALAIYWRIMLPLCKPAAAVLATFTFIGSWNSFFDPLIFLQSLEKLTVTVGLAYFRGESGTEWNLLMAASTITLLPTVLVFLFTQRYFIRGIAMSGLKY